MCPAHAHVHAHVHAHAMQHARARLVPREDRRAERALLLARGRRPVEQLAVVQLKQPAPCALRLEERVAVADECAAADAQHLV